MKTTKEIQDAWIRATQMRNRTNSCGTIYPALTYEDGLQEAFDWICEKQEDNPPQTEVLTPTAQEIEKEWRILSLNYYLKQHEIRTTQEIEALRRNR